AQREEQKLIESAAAREAWRRRRQKHQRAEVLTATRSPADQMKNERQGKSCQPRQVQGNQETHPCPPDRKDCTGLRRRAMNRPRRRRECRKSARTPSSAR